MNYNEAMYNTLKANNKRRKVLLHCCCAPCATYCVETLSEMCELTLLYYNPNITDYSEYNLRYEELVKLATIYEVKVIDAGYNDNKFFELVQGYENDRERGGRCRLCIADRMEYASAYAKDNGYDFYATTLTISPLKDTMFINEYGEKHCNYLSSDFKKSDGYKRSVYLTGKYGFYRQDFCGCEFSKKRY